MLKVPEFNESHNAIEVERDITLMSDQTLWIEESLHFKGYVAASLRSYFKGQEKHEKQAWAHNIIIDQSHAIELKEFHLLNETSWDQALIIKLTYTLKNSMIVDGQDYSFNCPAGFEMSYLRPKYSEHRKSPFRIQYPFTWKTHIRFNKPKSIKRLSYKWPGGQVDSHVTSFMLKEDNQDDALHLRFDLKEKAGDYSKESYTPYCDVLMKALGALTGRMEFSIQ